MTEVDKSNILELLTFQLGEQEYSLDIMSVREIRGWTNATPMPHAPAHMRGVINLRGTVLPVMDLAQRLGLESKGPSDRNVIIVVHYHETLTGLLVDAVSDIVAISENDTQPPPEMAGPAQSSVVRALTLIDDRMIRILDLAQIAPRAEGAAA